MNEQIKSRATVAFLRKIGYAKTLPRAIAYGPKSRSGLGIKNMGIEQGLKKVLCYLQHQRRGCRVGQMFRIYVESYQLISGLSQSVLEDTQPLPYIEYWWIGCMHQFLYCILGQTKENKSVDDTEIERTWRASDGCRPSRKHQTRIFMGWHNTVPTVSSVLAKHNTSWNCNQQWQRNSPWGMGL